MSNITSQLQQLSHVGINSTEVAARIGCTVDQLSRVRARFNPSSPEQQRLHDQIVTGVNQLVSTHV
jgi:hypothetical protein